MRPLLLGKNRYKGGDNYKKEPKVLKHCGNPDCKNTFIGTKNGKQEFCHRNCLRKIRGRSDRKKNIHGDDKIMR